MRTSLAGLILVGGAACGTTSPPHETEGGVGALARDPQCAIHVPDGYAWIDFAGDGDDLGWVVEVTLPGVDDLWGRGVTYVAAYDDAGCRWDVGDGVARVQVGSPIREPGCDDCAHPWRPLFVEGVIVPAVTACSSCDPTDCRAFEAARADRLAMWCYSPDEVSP